MMMEIAQETIRAFQKVITGDPFDNGDPIAPYRSGPQLVKFFNQFGERDEYGQGFPSRWNYTEQKLKYFNKSDVLKDVLKASVDPRHFLGTDYEVSGAVKFLNEFLIYDGYQFKKFGRSYELISTDEEIIEEIQDPYESLDREVVENQISIFISHSSNDVEVAKRLANLLLTSLKLNSEEIRCTSVDGYRLQGGAKTTDQLIQEIYDTKSFIGLITPNSIKSSFVLFELGARWGAKRQLIPLMSKGVTAKDLVAPLNDYNALDCGSRPQMLQLITELSQFLNCDVEKPQLYSSLIDDLIRASSDIQNS